MRCSKTRPCMNTTGASLPSELHFCFISLRYTNICVFRKMHSVQKQGILVSCHDFFFLGCHEVGDFFVRIVSYLLDLKNTSSINQFQQRLWTGLL
jgi:hypothetical protein